ncbi:MAG TPA: ATP-binding cassette domain-containing protein [Bacteroidia bacterium]|nr:ATP-binding cassette domain-containing protein [Bacteroidia bacterium]HMU18233.1 ATP-binding cassette domain-containing protein [Bacteroidia bacterium]
MFTVNLTEAGKKFKQHWIFRKCSASFSSGDVIGITGKNGSGKSTLLQVISGYVSPNEGKTEWYEQGKKIEADSVYRYLSIASPYLMLIEDFTLEEMIGYYFRFKNLKPSFNISSIITESGLEAHRNKLLSEFSSGMKQRTKLLLAIASDTPLLLLDEPCTNLDKQNIAWYQQFLKTHSHDRLIFICSNHIDDELFLCNKWLSVEDFKF